MKTHYILYLALVCLWPVGAQAQWQWLDKDGRKVFSDRAPPADIPAKDVLKQPPAVRRTSTVETADGAAEATPAGLATPAAKVSAPMPVVGKDKELEERKARADMAEQAQRQAQEQRNAQQRVENCNRARAAKASVESGRLLRQTNPQGEMVVMDDAARAAELRRIQVVIDASCQR